MVSAKFGGSPADLILNRILVEGETRRSIKGRHIHEFLDAQESSIQTKLMDALSSHLINTKSGFGFRNGEYGEFLQERLPLVLEAIEGVTVKW
ncbi:hypothetical protein ACFWIB_17040 [Streptomyces sp. NPDC127051]|uniref:hypothetical protein n=1 Tax=Streptomyces sp. NPDC127051 TaxID=3347119 RepID=UPI0036611D98